jgi:hypothetical protein
MEQAFRDQERRYNDVLRERAALMEEHQRSRALRTANEARSNISLSDSSRDLEQARQAIRQASYEAEAVRDLGTSDTQRQIEAAEADIRRLDAERELETIELQLGLRDSIEAGKPSDDVSAEQPAEGAQVEQPGEARTRVAARVCPTRGSARVIPCGEGNHRSQYHGPAWKDVLHVPVLGKARGSYHSVRNNRADPPRQAPPAPDSCGRYTPRFLGARFFRLLAVYILLSGARNDVSRYAVVGASKGGEDLA